MNDIKFYVENLMSDECACGAGKDSGKSFCHICFSYLPKYLRQDLYQSLRRGYEQAYDASVAELQQAGML